MRTLILAALAAALGAALPGTASAQTPGQKVVVNAKNGLAIEGYDPVSYFMAGPARGSEAFTASYLGATYRFTSAEHRDLFAASPAKYAPQFGGYCGYGASRGYLASVDPEAYTIMNGRLILQNSKSVLKLWQKEPDARLKLADENWPAIVDKEGKPLP
ncbi:MAG: YHS domain-containing (seleno)protein [Gemmatimonadales bacterium]